MRLALANGMLASMMFAETGAAGLCPWASTVTMKWTSSGQPTGPRRLRHLVRGEWSLQPGAKATPANRSSAGLPRPESHGTCSVCYTARANCSHSLTSFLFPLFKICFLGFCPISLPGNPTPICYNASGEVAPSPSHDLRIWASSWGFTLGTQNLQFLLSAF